MLDICWGIIWIIRYFLSLCIYKNIRMYQLLYFWSLKLGKFVSSFDSCDNSSSQVILSAH
jgi:hypothetical protein